MASGCDNVEHWKSERPPGLLRLHLCIVTILGGSEVFDLAFILKLNSEWQQSCSMQVVPHFEAKEQV